MHSFSLLYHEPTSSGEVSPFDAAILKVAEAGHVDIVSPYIGIQYLERLTAIAPQWRLVSDIEAWLMSLSIRARPRAWSFIRENASGIHHVPGIHAKAVIGPTCAYLGSANLTATGILGRHELGVLLQAKEPVEELARWFDNLWHQSSSPAADETSQFVKWLDDQALLRPAQRERIALSSTSQRVRAKLATVEVRPPLASLNNQTLDLARVAAQVAQSEARHFSSLADAIDAALMTVAGQEYSLRDISRFVQESLVTARLREIYLGLLHRCCNNPRTIFSEDTVYELVIEGGKFLRATPALVQAALEPYDRFLTLLFHHLDVDEERELPSEERFQVETGLRAAHQLILIAALVDSERLILIDRPGAVPTFQLNAEADWGGRWHAFAGATLAWRSKLELHLRRSPQVVPPEEEEAPVSGGHRAVWERDEALAEDLPWNRLRADQVAGKAARLLEQSRLADERRHKFDLVMDHVLSRLAKGESVTGPSIHYVATSLGTQCEVGPGLVQQILEARRGAPRVFQVSNTASGGLTIDINPGLTWEALEGYPLTQARCRELLQSNTE